MKIKKVLLVLMLIFILPFSINISAMEIKSGICSKAKDEAKLEELISNQKQYLYDYNSDDIKALTSINKNINKDKKALRKIKISKDIEALLNDELSEIYTELNTAFKYRVKYLEKNKTKYIEKSKIAYENAIEIYENLSKELLEENTTPKNRENIIGTSNKRFSEISTYMPSSVRNDVTGKWRLTRIATTEDILEYIKSYYITKFIDYDEIHAIVNFTLNTTTQVSKLLDNIVVVSIYDYVEKSEHDAKKLFTGNILSEYWIYLDNGDIEKIY